MKYLPSCTNFLWCMPYLLFMGHKICYRVPQLKVSFCGWYIPTKQFEVGEGVVKMLAGWNTNFNSNVIDVHAMKKQSSN